MCTVTEEAVLAALQAEGFFVGQLPNELLERVSHRAQFFPVRGLNGSTVYAGITNTLTLAQLEALVKAVGDGSLLSRPDPHLRYVEIIQGPEAHGCWSGPHHEVVIAITNALAAGQHNNWLVKVM